MMTKQNPSYNFYKYKCVICGAKHKHRNENKYPELCAPCARLAEIYSRQVAKEGNKIELMFSKVRVDLARVDGRMERQS